MSLYEKKNFLNKKPYKPAFASLQPACNTFVGRQQNHVVSSTTSRLQFEICDIVCFSCRTSEVVICYDKHLVSI